MTWTNTRLSTRECERIIRALGIDPDDLQAIVDNYERVEAALAAETARKAKAGK